MKIFLAYPEMHIISEMWLIFKIKYSLMFPMRSLS